MFVVEHLREPCWFVHSLIASELGSFNESWDELVELRSGRRLTEYDGVLQSHERTSDLWRLAGSAGGAGLTLSNASGSVFMKFIATVGLNQHEPLPRPFSSRSSPARLPGEPFL